MRIALIGARGQLGTALQGCLSEEILPFGHDTLDITDTGSVAEVLQRVEPDLVINAAAYNLVDQAEEEPQQAYAVNALGPRNLALACGERDLPLLHISSDYVFGLDGVRESPYQETAAPGPLGAYGLSKLAGEYYVRSLCRRHFVVRTCGLYGLATATSKENFIDKIYRLGVERGEVSVVNDQWCTPTSVVDLARGLCDLIRTDRYGLYHGTNTGGTTWHGLASEVFRCTGRDVQVKAVASSEFKTRARRPPYSVLNTDKLSGVLGYPLPEWTAAVATYLRQRGLVG